MKIENLAFYQVLERLFLVFVLLIAVAIIIKTEANLFRVFKGGDFCF
jgi:hypothetical protein